MIKQWTTTIIVTSIIFLVTWDIVAILLARSHDSSISTIMYELSQKHPIIPLAIGVIIGHFFWPVIVTAK